MKRFKILLLCLLFGCGDLGSSNSENTNNQIFNPEPVACETICSRNAETGEISVSSSCEGGFNAPLPSVEDCQTFVELPSEAETPSEETEEFEI